MRFVTHEGYLDLPGNWHDRSVNALLPTLPEIPGCNLVLTRDELPYGTEFDDYVSVQKAKYKRELNALQTQTEQNCEVDGRKAHFLEFSWEGDRQVIYQMALILLNAPQILTITYTSPGQLPANIRDAIGSAMMAFRFQHANEPA